MINGKVYLVGAGPGDVELITLKGYRLIRQADVILYDHLIPLELLRLAKDNSEIISVGKFAGNHTLSQSEINSLLVEKARGNHIVVRLKGGDPYLFGRGGEEVEACVEAGIEFEVVPGITSAFAAACYAGVPPTHRDCTSDVAIITGHRKNDQEIKIPDAGTLIFLMSVGNLEKIVYSLHKAGWPPDTPIAAVEHGTCYDQRVVKGTLDTFPEIAKNAKLRTPAIFIVGKVVSLQDKLDWFTRRPNVLVLGNHPERYQHLGNIIHRRIIDCVPLEEYTVADEIIRKIGMYDWIVFTSVNGAKYLFDRLFALHLDARALASSKIAVIGKSTAQRLRELGISADLIPSKESSVGLLDAFHKIDVAGKNFLLPQAELSSNELSEGLLEMYAVVTSVPVYKTIDLDPGSLDFEYIHSVLFTSGSTVRAFVKHWGQVPAHVKAFCLGVPTLHEAQKHNIQAQLMPDSPENSKAL